MTEFRSQTVIKKGQKIIPKGTKSGPKSIQNTAGNPTRKTIRKTDLPAAIRRPPPRTDVSADPAPPTPPRGAKTTGTLRVRFGKNMQDNAEK